MHMRKTRFFLDEAGKSVYEKLVVPMRLNLPTGKAPPPGAIHAKFMGAGYDIERDIPHWTCPYRCTMLHDGQDRLGTESNK